MGTKEKIAKNTLFNGAASIISVALYFFLMPFIIARLGLAQFGIYVLASSLVGYFALMELGASTSLVKYVAEHRARENRRGVQEVVSATFFLYLGIGMVSAVGIALVGWALLPHFNISAALRVEARQVLYVMAFVTLATWPLTTFRHALAGLQRYDLISITGVAVSAATGVATLTLLSTGYGLVALVAAEGAISVLGLLVLSITCVRALGYQPIRVVYAKVKVFKGVVGFSLMVFVIQLSQSISYRSDTIVLGLFLPIGAIALFEAANKIQRLCERVFNIANSAILPAASELDAAGQSETLEKLFLKGSAYTAAATLSVAIPLFLLARWLLVYWLGSEFGQVALAAQVFVSFWFFSALAGLTRTVLVGAGRVRLLAGLVFLRSILNLLLSLILVQRFQILGVVLGTVISEVVFYPIIITYALRSLGSSWRKYYAGVVLKAVRPAVLTASILYVALALRAPAGLFEVALYSLVTVSIYALGFFWLSLDAAEKAELRLFTRLGVLRPAGRRAG